MSYDLEWKQPKLSVRFSDSDLAKRCSFVRVGVKKSGGSNTGIAGCVQNRPQDHRVTRRLASVARASHVFVAPVFAAPATIGDATHSPLGMHLPSDAI